MYLSLYTNVAVYDTLQAVSKMFERHVSSTNIYGLSRTRILVLIKECMKCNIFKWSGEYYSQIRGLAMGQRLAPVLAVCFMSKIEQPVLERLPLMYCRYIDDCCVITSTQSEMDECFKILNEQSQYIKLTREIPRDGWLPYLNTQIHLSGSTAHVKWYRKDASQNILLHAKSAHPVAMKRAVIRNMFRTVAEICTGDEELLESRNLAKTIVRSNGYSIAQNRSRRSMRSMNTRQDLLSTKVPLCVPFISDKVTSAIRKCITRAQLENDVILINIPNDNLRKQLVRNRIYDTECISRGCVVCPSGKIGDCAKMGVVYELECQTCNAIYIGETGRALGVRVSEHLAGKRRGNVGSPLGKHKVEVHNGEEFEVKCKILEYETEIAARKALEAAWIYRKGPTMNARNECISIASDLLSLVSLCER